MLHLRAGPHPYHTKASHIFFDIFCMRRFICNMQDAIL